MRIRDFISRIAWHRQTSLRPVLRRLLDVEWHFVSMGAFAGVNSRLDPEWKPRPVRAAIDGALLLLLCLLLFGVTVRLALLLVLASPVWLYIFVTVYDSVLEYRGYISLIGVAILGAHLTEQAPGLIFILIALFAIRTSHRISDYKTSFGFWARAHQECPNKPRPWVNYAERLQAVGRVDEAIAEYEQILSLRDRCAATAAGNLGIIYLQKSSRATTSVERDAWIIKAADMYDEAAERFPTHDMLATNRGAFFMGLRRWEDAVHEFNIAIYLNPKNSSAYRNRGKCYAFLGRTEDSDRDYESARHIDGRNVDPFLIRGPRPHLAEVQEVMESYK